MKKLLIIIATAGALVLGAAPAGANQTPTRYEAKSWVCGSLKAPYAAKPFTAHVLTYRVQRGDTLWRIAVRAYGPGEKAGRQWHKIAKANHLHGTRIRVGQVLVVPL